MLHSKSVPHILEKIFFSLDSKTFDVCREVCRTWKGLLASDEYQKNYDELLLKEEKARKEVIRHLIRQGLSLNQITKQYKCLSLTKLCK